MTGIQTSRWATARTGHGPRPLVVLFLLLVVGLLPPTGPAGAKTGGPKTFNLYLRNSYDPPDTLLLANWDALGLDVDTPDAVLVRLKQLNPNIKLLAYVPINGTYANANIFAPTSKWREMWEAANTNNWWLRNTQGGIVYDHPGKYTFNLTVNCPQNGAGQTFWDWYPQWIKTSVLRNGAAPWDGVILDDVWTAIWFVGVDTRLNQYQIDSDRDDLGDDQPTLDALWRAGNDTVSARVRRLMPAAKILSGNGQNTFYHMNGSFIEAFPYNGTLDVGTPVPGYAWNDKMFGPVGYFSNEDHYSGSPQRLDVNDAKWADGDAYTPVRTPEFMRHKRFCLASTMLRDGYFAISWQQATQGHNSIWWEAEYDKQIGTPTGAPFQAVYNGVTLWRRNYTNGIVLVNGNYTNFPGSAADGLPPIHFLDGAILLTSEIGVVDTTPPPTINDLTVTRTWPDQIEVRWTNVTDNVGNGQDVQLEVRYSTSPINEGNYASASVGVANLLPDAPGTLQAYITSGLSAGLTYYFAVKTKDMAGNWSLCSNSPGGLTVTGDVTAPSTITSLAVDYTTSTTARVSWNTTGDDGNTGTAASFDLRYATFPLSAANWGSGAQVVGEPAPAAPGTHQQLLLYGMQPNTTYYFGIKVCDEMPNCSALSNTPSGTTLSADQTPPAAITDLRVTAVGTNGYTLSWTAPGDDDLNGRATSYDNRFATFVINAGNFTTANYSTSEPGPATAGSTQFMTQTGLGNGFTYHIAMKTLDELANASDISNVVTVTTGANPPADVTPPDPVNSLFVSATNANTVTLGWNAPGDDGSAGTPTAYDLRYSTTPMTASSYATALPVFGEALPGSVGTATSLVVTGLTTGTLYYFGVKTFDEVGNVSTLSNVVSATPGSAPPPVDVTAPAAVANLALGTITQTGLTVSWTAPGDDGSSGTAASYELRYSTAAITAGNFAAATLVASPPAPAVAGTAQSKAVTGLTAGTTYLFALKTADEAPNWSALSNVPSAATLPASDVTAPAAVANLALGTITQTGLTVSWTAPGDDGAVGTAASYELRYSTAAITAGNFAAATLVAGPPVPAVAGTAQSKAVTGLTAGTTYFFALKTADEVPNWSAISNVPSAATLLAPDVTAPSAVANLALGTITQTGLTVSWTAPGDDGSSGTAASYELRYSTSAITAGNFAAATLVASPPAPTAAGTAQSKAVTGLAAGTTYFFALRTADEVPNWSALSNVPTASTLPPSDVTAPAAVANLAAGSPTLTSLTVSWSAPGDDGAVGTATSYDLRYSVAPITAGNFASAAQATGEPAPLSPGTAQSLVVSGLASGTTYYFALKSADEVPNWSALSNVPSTSTVQPPDTTAPANVTNLLAISPTQTSLTITWTAPGDDGASGTAAQYDLRYSTSTITAGNWASATPVSGEPAPALHGTGQSKTVSGLTVATTYYFAMVTMDEVPNSSGLSNVAIGTTAATPPPPDTTAPAAVLDLAVSAPTTSSLGVSWTAPGDDGSTGVATIYDLRYSTSVITAGNFSAATAVAGEPSPAPAGATESLVVPGLNASTTYYFALKTSDEAANFSSLSNVPSGLTSTPPPPPPVDVTAPAAVTNLAAGLVVSLTAGGDVNLTWTAPGDDGSVGTAAAYDVRYAATAITAASFAAATALGNLPTPTSAGATQSVTVGNLAEGGKFWFALKTADESGNWSGLSNVVSVTIPIPVDAVPPAAVVNLVAFSPTASGLTLSWSAPGDDGMTGTATTYDLRYSTAPISSGNFSAATAVSGEPAPAPAGGAQSLTVTGLAASTTYYFALKTADEVPNWSTISNAASATTLAAPPPPDTTPPDTTTSLNAGTITTTSVALAWTAPGDDGATGRATSFDVRYSTSTITAANFAAATPATGEPTPGNTGAAQAMTVGNLQSNTTYFFALRTSDEAGNVSALSNVISRTTLTPPDLTAPAAVTNLSASGPTQTSVTLGWTAPGDDGAFGTAAAYDLRYSTSALSESNFAFAQAVTGEPVPMVAGSAQSKLVSGLTAGTLYYFALKTTDEAGSISGLSNVAQVITAAAPPPPDTTAPTAVTDLAIAAIGEASISLTWHAPWDAPGPATGYELRYSAQAITPANFAGATPVAGLPAPLAAGTAQSMTVAGLAAGTTYHFALRSSDLAGNISGLSNAVSGTTPVPPPPPDTVAPAAVATLEVLSTTTAALTVRWLAPADEGDTGRADHYDLRLATSEISAASFDAAVPIADEPAPGAPGAEQLMTLDGLTPGTTYFVALRSFDEAGNRSGLSNVALGRTEDEPPPPPPVDTTPPAAVTLFLAEAGQDTIRIVWIAPGDDGLTGTASTYDLRLSTTPLTEATFEAATPVAGTPNPSVAGSPEAFVVRGLAPSTTWYLAIRTRDDAGNWSAPGPGLSARTLDPPPATSPPLAPEGLTVTIEGTTVTLTWQPNSESDLAGYRVLRRVNGGAWQERSIGILLSPAFTEAGLEREVDYDYALTALNRTGQESGQSTAWRVRLEPEPPAFDQLQLASASPNPFLGALAVTLNVPPAGETDLTVAVYDVAGRPIRTLHTGPLDGGSRTLTWDGADDAGRPTPAGVYLIVLRSVGTHEQRKVIRAH